MNTNDHEPDLEPAEGAFFRPGRTGSIRVQVPSRPMSAGEADDALRTFFTKLAGQRPLEPRDDVEDLVVDNALLVLLGPAEEAELRSLFESFPSETAERWDLLLRGGVAADTFGARTDDEVAEEERIDADLKGGRRRRIVLFAVLAVVVVGAGLGVRELLQSATDDPGPSLSDFFGGEDEPTRNDDGAVAPVAVGEFTTILSTVVAVEVGPGEPEDRIVTDPPPEILAVAPGTVGAALFQFRGEGYVAVVGPEGFAEQTCIEVAAVTPQLRALEVTSHGECAGLSEARSGAVACAGADLVFVQLQVPDRAVELPEGGTGVASEVRVGVLSTAERFETVEVRGSIGVLPDGDVVTVPRFAGPDGSDVALELPSGLSGSCTIEAS